MSGCWLQQAFYERSDIYYYYVCVGLCCVVAVVTTLIITIAFSFEKIQNSRSMHGGNRRRNRGNSMEDFV